MQEKRIKRLPVVGRDGLLIGIISRADVLSVFERADAEICAEVAAVIKEEFGLDPEIVYVTVASGIVTITGPVYQRESALSVLGRIRHVDGVVSVRDRLSYSAATQQDESASDRTPPVNADASRPIGV